MNSLINEYIAFNFLCNCKILINFVLYLSRFVIFRKNMTETNVYVDFITNISNITTKSTKVSVIIKP